MNVCVPNEQGKKLFREAKDSIGLNVTLTAAMGKRTKFQQQDHAQLLVVAKSAITPNAVPAVCFPPPPSLDTDEDHTGDSIERIDTIEAVDTIDNNADNQSSGWDNGKYEVGRRVVIEDVSTGEEVAVRRILLDDTDGGAKENILLEEGVRFTHLVEKQSGEEQKHEETNDLTSSILHPLDQAVILALCLDVSNSNPAVSHNISK